MIRNLNNIYSTPIKPNFKSSLINMMAQKYGQNSIVTKQQDVSVQQPVSTGSVVPISTPTASLYNSMIGANSLLNLLTDKIAAKQTQGAQKTQNTTPSVKVSTTQSNSPINYKNNLRSLFQNNQAVIYAMIPRTFNAKNTNENELIEGNEEPGYFTNMVERLDELKSYGINTLHWLPINPTGASHAKGNVGSVYSPKDYLSIDPNLDDPKNPQSVYEEAKYAINECHKRGIRVMLDLPSCMSVDLYEARPDLRAETFDNKPKTPEGWEDIRMFNPWADEDKKILNKALLDYHKKFVDMCLDLGIDGIRADVGRAKPPQFWDELISYTRSKDPEFAYLAECYTYEDASPMKNMPADRPEESLEAGFDSYYGQYHIFNIWKAKDFHDFIKESLDITQSQDVGKSLIGSFATHDDKSPMANGGPDYCMMTNVVQTTVPMTNPYIVTGFESGDTYIYQYGDKLVDKTFAEILEHDAFKYTIAELKTFISVTDDFVQLMNSSSVNKTLDELSKDEKYSKLIDVLSKFCLTKALMKDENKGKTIKELDSNGSISNLCEFAQEITKENGNLLTLLSTDAVNKKLEELENSEYKNIIDYLKENANTKDCIKYYITPEHLDIFNSSRKPAGKNPEIGQHFGYLMNTVRPQFGEVITKGAYIKLPVKNNGRDEVIAYARHKDGKTLVTIVNHDVNSSQKVKVIVPGMSETQTLNDLSPKYGAGSTWNAKKGAIEIDLGPSQAHIFEVDVPDFLSHFKKEDIWQQKF